MGKRATACGYRQELTHGTKMLALKLMLTILVGLLMAGTLFGHLFKFPILSGALGLEFRHGVNAALFALAAATLLFIAALPNRVQEGPFTPAQKLDGVLRVVISFATFLAGSFWLLHETGGKPAPYLLTVLVLGTITAISSFPYALYLLFLESRHRRRGGG